MTCRMRVGFALLIRLAAPISNVPAMMLPRRIGTTKSLTTWILVAPPEPPLIAAEPGRSSTDRAWHLFILLSPVFATRLQILHLIAPLLKNQCRQIFRSQTAGA